MGLLRHPDKPTQSARAALPLGTSHTFPSQRSRGHRAQENGATRALDPRYICLGSSPRSPPPRSPFAAPSHPTLAIRVRLSRVCCPHSLFTPHSPPTPRSPRRHTWRRGAGVAAKAARCTGCAGGAAHGGAARGGAERCGAGRCGAVTVYIEEGDVAEEGWAQA